jgi:PST family polysaccharide transporter
MMLRVASWPMGYILLAKGARQPFFWSELASSVVQVALVWFCILGFGLNGTGIAFAAAYAFYWCLIYAIVRSVSGFRWSPANQRVGLLYGLLVLGVFLGRYWLPQPWVLVVGLVATVLTGLFSMRRVCRLVPLDRMPRSLRGLFTLLRLAPANPAP